MNLCSRVYRGVFALLGAASIWACVPTAEAQEYDLDFSTGYQPFAIPFNEAASRSSGSAFQGQSFFGVTSFFLGVSYPWPLRLNAFPEALIADDAARINQVYEEALIRQVSSDPVIRTPDLINPFNTSILTQPSFIDID
ncbi:MAG: hypothetical protein WBA13_17570 [Microcoleaceae cyanobacterium]